MARKGHIAKRETLADPMYNSVLVSKLVNQIMLDGKKGVAQKIVYNAFAKVEAKSGKPAVEAFEEAMNNIMPKRQDVSVVQHTRFRSKFVRTDARLWLCAG